MSQNDPFSAPGSSNFDIPEYKGNLLLITPLAFETEVKTTFGEKDAVRADIVILDGEDGPEAHDDVLIFPLVLIGQTKGRVGKGMVLGRLGQREPSKPGQNPAWALEDPTDEDKQAARDYLASVDPFEAA